MKRACGENVNERALASILKPNQRQLHLPLEEQAEGSTESTSCLGKVDNKCPFSFYITDAPGSQTARPERVPSKPVQQPRPPARHDTAALCLTRNYW
jgi:hypothetical protein